MDKNIGGLCMKQGYMYKKKKKNVFLTLIIIFIIILLFTGGGVVYYKNLISPLDLNGEEKIVEIPQGYSVKNISQLLQREGIIKKGLAFEIAVRLEDLQSQLQSGRYLLSPSMSTKEVLFKIADGQVIDDSIKVTIPEGFELTMIAERLEEKGLTTKDEFIKAATQDIGIFDYSFLKDIPKDRDNPLEGYLFPDTYHFSIDVTEEQIITAMLDRFNNVFIDEYYDRAKELGMTIDEVVILASVVEREAMVASDRPIISGVFHKRLEIGMKLESCATIQYILGERKPRLLYSDLEIVSPYNTYKELGLPVGPIASFGEDSLKATLYPEDTEYLFFVAKDDGSHVFSRTLEEHNAAKKRVLN